MPTLNEYFLYGQLAQASYAYFGGNSPIRNPDETQTANALRAAQGGFTPSQADQLQTRFGVVDHQANDAVGFSATLLLDRIANKYVLAIRGTEPGADSGVDLTNADLDLWVNGAAHAQIVSLYNYFLRLKTPTNERVNQYRYDAAGNQATFLTEVNGLGLLPASGAVVDVTGHSLGGHLSIALSRIFPANVANVYTYNAPGFKDTSEINAFFSSMGSALSFDPAKIFNTIGSEATAAYPGWNAIAGWHSVPGPTQEVFIENQLGGGESPQGALNHSQLILTDALAVYGLLSDLAPAADVAKITNVLRAASNTPYKSLETTLGYLLQVFLGESNYYPTNNDFGNVVEIRDRFYSRLADLKSNARYQSIKGSAALEDLTGRSQAEIGALARTDFGAFLALRTLSPLALLGASSVHSVANSGLYGRWQLAMQMPEPQREFTDRWFEDRSAFLKWRNLANAADVSSQIDVSSSENWRYQDIAQAYSLVLFGGAGAPPLPQARWAVFGGDNADGLQGAQLADRMYGGAGSDILAGGAGNDYLEGGAGTDVYQYSGRQPFVGDPTNDGADEIRDIDGKGAIRYTFTQGGVFSDTVQNKVVGGLGIKQSGTEWKSPDGKFTYARQSSGLLVTINEDAGGTIFILDFDFAKAQNGGYLGIRLSDGIPEAPQNPVRTFIGDKLNHDGDPSTPDDIDPVEDGFGNYVRADGQDGRPDRPLADRVDLFYGSVADEVEKFATAGGNDRVFGDGASSSTASVGGRDLIETGAGRDIVDAGAKDDYVEGGAEGDILSGDAGDDVIYADTSNTQTLTLDQAINLGETATSSTETGDLLAGGVGGDILIGANTGDLLLGGSGADVIAGGGGDDNVFGDDSLTSAGLGWTVTRTLVVSGDSGIVLLTTQAVDIANDPVSGSADAIYAGAGDDWVFGGAGDDFIDGGNGTDVLLGDGGSDIVLGGEGDDVMDGDSAEAAAAGVAGEDYLDGGAGNDILLGGGGSDILIGAEGNDQLYGGLGDDLLIGGRGQDILSGGAGKDTYVFHAGDVVGNEFINDVPAGASSADASVLVLNGYTPGQIKFRTGSLAIDLGDGGQIHIDGFNSFDPLSTPVLASIQFEGGEVMSYQDVLDQGFDLDGTDGNDFIQGTAVTDRIDAKAGNDIVFANSGNDTITGGTGNDLLQGGEGDDAYLVDLGDGDDTINDVGGTNVVRFGEGVTPESLFVSTAVEFDEFFGFGSYTRIDYGDQGDFVKVKNQGLGAVASYEFAGGQTLSAAEVMLRSISGLDIQGTGADETIYGTNLADSARGSDGADTLLGHAGNDVLWGDGGVDILTGDAGDDLLQGGPGDDLYLLGLGDGVDVIDDIDGTNTIRFGTGIASPDLHGRPVNGTDGGTYFELSYGPGERVYIREAMAGAIQTFEFADGSSMDFGQAMEAMLDEPFHLDYRGSAAPLSLHGSRFDDTVIGSDGVNTLSGGAGNDSLAGGAASDSISGGAGDDLVIGGGSSDVLLGGDGADTFQGDGGDDELSGGLGHDTYRMFRGMGKDLVLEQSGETSSLKLLGLGTSDLTAERRGADLYVHVLGNRDGVLIRDYYAGSTEEGIGAPAAQTWQFVDGAGNVTAFTGWLGTVPTAPRVHSLAEAIADYHARTRAFYGSALVQSGYSEQPSGDFLRVSETQSLTFSSHDETRISFNTVTQPENFPFRTVELFDQQVSFTSEQTTTEVTVNQTAGSSFSAGRGSSGSQFVSFGGPGQPNGVQVELGSVVVPVYGPNIWTDPITGETQRERVGHQIYPPGSPSLQNGAPMTTTQTVVHTHTTTNRNLQLNIAEIFLGAADDELGFPFFGFNVVDAGAGNDRAVTGRSMASSDGIIFVPNGVGTVGADGAPGHLIYGNAGNDYLRGGADDDVILGGADDDLMHGDGGNDRYIVFAGDGADTILEDGATRPGVGRDNVLQLPDSVLPSDLQFAWGETQIESRNWNTWLRDSFLVDLNRVVSKHTTLTLTWGTADSVRIVLPHAEHQAALGIDSVSFGDGSELSLQQLLQLAPPVPTLNVHGQANILTGTGGTDLLSSGGGADTVHGGGGQDWIYGDDGDDILEGGEEDDLIHGGRGADDLRGDDGDDILGADIVDFSDAGNTYRGGAGRDFLLGTRAGDLYLFDSGDSEDLIGDYFHREYSYEQYPGVDHHDHGDVLFYGGGLYGDGPYGFQGTPEVQAANADIPASVLLAPSYTANDTIRFGSGIAPGDLEFVRGRYIHGSTAPASQDDLVIGYGRTDLVQLIGWYTNQAGVVDRLEFADGTVWSAAEIAQHANDPGQSLAGTVAAETLTGARSNDYLSGQGGDDVLAGGLGDDTYYYNPGDGRDRIEDVATSAAGNSVRFGDGITEDMLSLSTDGTVRIGPGGDAIVLAGFDVADPYGAHAVDRFYFANGAYLSYTELVGRGFQVHGTPGDDILIGTASAELILGYEGNDVLEGGAQSDNLFGGEGNDILAGQAGDDSLEDLSGNNVVLGGEGSDALYAYEGASFLAGGTETDSALAGNRTVVGFNAGDGDDYLSFASAGQSFTLSLGGITLGDIRFTKVEDYDFLLHIGASDAIHVWAYGADPQYWPAITLQLIGSDIRTYDLGAAIQAHRDAASPDSWDAQNALAANLLSVSTTEALGGAIAYEYATTGASASSAAQKRQVLESSDFGLAPQSISYGQSNQAPTLDAPLGDQMANEDSAFAYQVSEDAFSDPDAGDTLTYSAVLSTGSALPGWLSFNAQTRTFSGTPLQANVGSMDVTVTATDAGGLDAEDTFTLTIANVNDIPVVTAANAELLRNDSAAAASLFSVTDEDGNPVVQYEFWDDVADGGYWSLAGVAQGTNPIPVSAAALADLQYVAGAEAGTEQVWVRAHDGTAWSAWKNWNMTSALHIPNAAPVVNAQATQTVTLTQTVDVSALFSATDGDGDPIARYEFWDSTAGNGHFALDGVEQGVNVAIAVTAAQLANAQFVGSSTTGSDLLWVRANDSQSWGEWKSWTMNSWPHLVNAAPVVSAADATLLTNAAVGAGSLFSVTDADGDAIARYEFWDDANGGGYFRVDGAQQGSVQAIAVTAEALADTEYVGGANGGTEQVWVRANDGMEWSTWQPWSMTTALHIPNAAPVVTASDSTVLLGQSVASGTLFSVTDADNDAITQYEFWDSTAGSGHFSVDGAAAGVNVAIAVTAAQLASTQFVGAGSTGSDMVWVRANDGQTWSDWKSWYVNSWPHLTNAAPVATAQNDGLLRNEAVGAGSLFTLSDADGDAVARYEFWDDVNGGGHWRVDGVQQAAGQAIAVEAVDFADTAYIGGANAGTEQVWVRANDGMEWGAWRNWLMSTEGGMLRGGLGPDTLSGEAGPTVLEGGAGDDSLTDTEGNNLLSGGTGGDNMTGGAGNDLFAGGDGDDVVNAGAGSNVIAFNAGDGIDTLYSAAGASNTLSFGGGIGYNDLALSKDGNDLIVSAGANDRVVLKDWYAGADNVLNLQVVLDASDEFDAGSSDPLYNKKVQTFDFLGLVDEFNQALAASPGLTSWAVTNALLQFHLSAADDAALGGDLAYWYGKNGGLTGISLAAAQQVIGASGFGSDAQTLRPFNGLQEGFVKLA